MQGPEIKAPQHVQAEYRLAIAAGIVSMHNVARAAANGTLSESAIGRVVTRIARFSRSFLDDGSDATGVTNLARAGRGFRTIRRSIFETERLQREALRPAAVEALGQRATNILTRRRLGGILETAIRQNVTLIRGVTEQQTVLIETALRQALQQPDLQGQTLIDTLADVQGRGTNRAALIADNEIANFHSDLQQRRFQDLGVERYIWRSSQDERVRRRPVSHVALDGQEFLVGHPTTAEGGLPPGKPIRCRCVAIPTFVVQ